MPGGCDRRVSPHNAAESARCAAGWRGPWHMRMAAQHPKYPIGQARASLVHVASMTAASAASDVGAGRAGRVVCGAVRHAPRTTHSTACRDHRRLFTAHRTPPRGGGAQCFPRSHSPGSALIGHLVADLEVDVPVLGREVLVCCLDCMGKRRAVRVAAAEQRSAAREKGKGARRRACMPPRRGGVVRGRRTPSPMAGECLATDCRRQRARRSRVQRLGRRRRRA